MIPPSTATPTSAQSTNANANTSTRTGAVAVAHRRGHARSPFVKTLTNQRASRLLLAGLWGNNYESSSSKDDEESKDDSDKNDKDDDDKNAQGQDGAKETTKDEDTVAASSSYETADALLPTDDLDLVATSTSTSAATDSKDMVLTSSNSDSSAAASTTTTTTSSEKSLWVLLNEIGNNFQGMAQRATKKGSESDAQSKKIIYAAKGSVYYTLFILYRAYRGFFVLLPATFLQVYRKMEAVMNTGNLSLDEIGVGDDAVGKSSKWRTKLTVSILSTVITLSYVAGGLLKMTTKFLRTIAKTSDVSKSFEAAADEVMDFEGRISRVGKINGEDGVDLGANSNLNANDDDSNVGNVGNPSTSGLAP